MQLNRIVYQIYPKSFMDSNGDGIGDIKGITQKLNYLEELGINMLWLTPIFKSPQNDNGYDVEDYYSIDPLFGTMEDVEELIYLASTKGIDIMFDMVLNHTSTHHKWFQKALEGDKKYQDYYFFKEKPTNWISKFGGNAWEYVESLDLYYLHLFDVSQADLNWENPEVFQEVTNIVNYWLDKGVKGLRFDVINLISKPDVFEDDDIGDGRRFYSDGPNVHTHIHNLNKHSFGKRENILTVGELSSTNLENGVTYANPKNEELATIFNFHHLKVDYKEGKKWMVQDPDFIEYKKIIAQWQYKMQDEDANMAVFLNNHDQPRSVSRFGDDRNYAYESATLWAGITLCLRGIPYLFQGEEIGLPNAYFDTITEYRDIESINYYNMHPHLDNDTKLHVLNHHSRDNSRTPIPWDNTTNYGFSTQTPWIPFTKAPNFKTVEDNLNNPNSVYHFYKKLIKFRKESPLLLKGSIDFFEMENTDLFMYSRTLDAQKIWIIGNITDKSIQYPKVTGEILLSNYNQSNIPDTLQPYELLIIYHK